MKLKKHFGKIYIGVFLIFFVPRVIGLGGDIANFDSSYWYPRMDEFTKHLLRGDYKETYQKYHPGVTMLWTSGTAKYAFEKSFETFLGFNPRYMPHQFPRMHFVTKFPLVFIISLIGVSFYYFLSRLFNKKFALLFSIILSLEPFFLGVSRFLHLSALTSVLMFLSFIILYWYYQDPVRNKFKIRNTEINPLYVSAIILGLGTLTKIDAIIAGPVNGLLILFYEFQLSKKDVSIWIKSSLVRGLSYLGLVCLTFYVLFPSMWVAPKWTIMKIIHDGIEDTAFSSSGADSLFGIKYLFYPEMVFFRSLPTFAIGATIGIFLSLRNLVRYKKFTKTQKSTSNLLLWTIFYIFFNMLILSVPDKIKDRYLINLYPPLAILATYFVYLAYISKQKLLKYGVVGVFAFFYILTAYKYHPVYSFYYSELIGGPGGREKLGLPIKNRGEFYAQAAQFINEYDDNPAIRNVVLSHREQIRTFGPFFLGETFTNPNTMKDGYFADYILTRPDFDYLVPQDMCTCLKSFGPKEPFGYDIIKVYKCEGITNDYSAFKN